MPKPIKLLDNANQIITLLSEIGSARHSAIASDIEVPRATVYRLVDGLAAVGMVRVEPATGLVRLSERWLGLSDMAQQSFSEWHRIIELLPTITGQTKQTAFLSIPTSHGAACIAWSQASSLVVLSLRPGRQLPFNVGAAGRLLFALSAAPDATGCSFQAFTDRSITSQQSLLEDADYIRREGWVLSDQDVNVGISAVGVPVYSEGLRDIGCLSIAGLSQDLNEHASDFARILMDLVD